MCGWTITPQLLRKRITILSVTIGGMLCYYLWEAMLISYFSTPTTSLPFNSLEGLLTKSDKKVPTFVWVEIELILKNQYYYYVMYIYIYIILVNYPLIR